MIEVKNVKKRYRKVKALDDVSFSIGEEKLHVFLE